MTTLNKSVCRGNQRSAISKWPVEETGRNSVIPSIIPSRMTVIQSGIHRRNREKFQMTSSKRVTGIDTRHSSHVTRELLSAKHSGEGGFGFIFAAAHLQLAKDGMPANINFVPLIFERAQSSFAHIAEVAKRRRIADERMNFLFRGSGDLDGGQNQLQFLDN